MQCPHARGQVRVYSNPMILYSGTTDSFPLSQYSHGLARHAIAAGAQNETGGGPERPSSKVAALL